MFCKHKAHIMHFNMQITERNTLDKKKGCAGEVVDVIERG